METLSASDLDYAVCEHGTKYDPADQPGQWCDECDAYGAEKCPTCDVMRCEHGEETEPGSWDHEFGEEIPVRSNPFADDDGIEYSLYPEAA